MRLLLFPEKSAAIRPLFSLFFRERISRLSCIFLSILQLVCSFDKSFMQKNGLKTPPEAPRCIFGTTVIFLDIFRKNCVQTAFSVL